MPWMWWASLHTAHIYLSLYSSLKIWYMRFAYQFNFRFVRFIHQVRGYTMVYAKWYRKFTACFRAPTHLFFWWISMFNLQAITITCLYLHHKYLHDTYYVSLLATVTFVGYTFILLILLIGKQLFNKWIFFHPLLLIVLLFIRFGSSKFLFIKNCHHLSNT